MKNKILTLCIVHEEKRILLGMKKRGFGAGRWNGFGGKVQEGESVEDAAKRELQEEAGIITSDLQEDGYIEFEFQGNPEILEVHVFRVNAFEGEPSESEEMKPEWFDFEKIPYQDMWPDDEFWLPLFLSGKKIRAKFLFEGENKILEQKIDILN